MPHDPRQEALAVLRRLARPGDALDQLAVAELERVLAERAAGRTARADPAIRQALYDRALGGMSVLDKPRDLPKARRRP